MEKTLAVWLDLLTHQTRDGDLFEMPVLSGSMMKELVPGRLVKIKIVKAFRRLRVGDIAIFKQGLKLYSHRVLIRINLFDHKKIYQKGDTNSSGSWIDGKDVLGRVVESVTYNGRHIQYDKKGEMLSARFKALYHLFSIFIFFLISVFKKTLKLVIKA